MRKIIMAGAAALLLGGAAVLGAMGGASAQAPAPAPAPYSTGPHNITVPADWETTYIRYALVENADRKIIRHIYVNPEAFAAARPGQPLPYGTTIIMADTRVRLDAEGKPLLDQQGRFIPIPGWIAIGMQQKERGWGEGYPPEMRNGEWEYAAFDGAGARRNIPLNSCFACHIGARAQQDFAFNFWDFVQGRR